MDTLDLIDCQRKSFTVSELRKMLGIQKTESYWILKHRKIETVRINGRIRILQSSFDKWYANQTKYHIIGGPEPGAELRANSYSPKDLMEILDVSEYVAYTLIAKGCFETFTADYTIRVTKESFDRWYASQDKYRLADDRRNDLPTITSTYSLQDIQKMLGVHRNTVYYILERHKDAFEVRTVAGRKRVMISSFDRWYHSQSRYAIKEAVATELEPVYSDVPAGMDENTLAVSEAAVRPEKPLEKEIYRLEDLMELLQISRKAAYKLIQSGELLAVKAGKAYLIPASEYQRFAQRRENDGFNHPEE